MQIVGASSGSLTWISSIKFVASNAAFHWRGNIVSKSDEAATAIIVSDVRPSMTTLGGGKRSRLKMGVSSSSLTSVSAPVT